MEQVSRAGEQGGEVVEPRFLRRLSDRITIVFYEACRTTSIRAARHLAVALELQVAHSVSLSAVDTRDDGNDLAAVRARLAAELAKHAAPSTLANIWP